jgi:hypothetical protein
MELARLELATSWVRSRRFEAEPLRYGQAGPAESPFLAVDSASPVPALVPALVWYPQRFLVVPWRT